MISAQKAFSDMSEEELRQIIVDVYNQIDPNFSNAEGALNELLKRLVKK